MTHARYELPASFTLFRDGVVLSTLWNIAMTKFKLKPLIVAVTLSVASFGVAAHLSTSRAVLAQPTDSTVISVNFKPAVSGDLYLATVVNGKLVFFADQGKVLSDTPKPFQKSGVFDGQLDVLNVNALGIPAARYPLYEVVVAPGSDVLNFSNWVGGLGGLHRMNISIGLPAAVTGDYNNDGFADDDNDHDGYHDGDRDFNGEDDAVEQCKASKKDKGDNGEKDDEHGSHNGSNVNVGSVTCNPAPVPAPTPTPTLTPVAVSTPAPVSVPVTIPASAPAATFDGKALFTSHCSACHTVTDPADSVRKSTIAPAITAAITTVKQMKGIILKDAEKAAIAVYIKAN